MGSHCAYLRAALALLPELQELLCLQLRHTHTRTRTRTHTHTNIQNHSHACARTRTNASMRIRMRTNVRAHTPTHTHKHAHAHAHTAQLRRGLQPMWLRSPCRLVWTGRASNWPRNARSVATPVSFESSSHSISLMPPESWRRSGLGPGADVGSVLGRPGRARLGVARGLVEVLRVEREAELLVPATNQPSNKTTRRATNTPSGTRGAGGRHAAAAHAACTVRTRRAAVDTPSGAAVGTHQSGLSVLKRIVVVRLRLPWNTSQYGSEAPSSSFASKLRASTTVTCSFEYLKAESGADVAAS